MVEGCKKIHNVLTGKSNHCITKYTQTMSKVRVSLRAGVGLSPHLTCMGELVE